LILAETYSTSTVAFLTRQLVASWKRGTKKHTNGIKLQAYVLEYNIKLL